MRKLMILLIGLMLCGCACLCRGKAKSGPIELGMSVDEVQEILGDPDRTYMTNYGEEEVNIWEYFDYSATGKSALFYLYRDEVWQIEEDFDLKDMKTLPDFTF